MKVVTCFCLLVSERVWCNAHCHALTPCSSRVLVFGIERPHTCTWISVASLFEYGLVTAFVAASPFLTPCQGTHCGGFVMWDALETRLWCSSCHSEYCPQSKCRLPVHAPVSCEEFMSWAEIGGCCTLGTKVCVCVCVHVMFTVACSSPQCCGCDAWTRCSHLLCAM